MERIGSILMWIGAVTLLVVSSSQLVVVTSVYLIPHLAGEGPLISVLKLIGLLGSVEANPESVFLYPLLPLLWAARLLGLPYLMAYSLYMIYLARKSEKEVVSFGRAYLVTLVSAVVCLITLPILSLAALGMVLLGILVRTVEYSMEGR